MGSNFYYIHSRGFSDIVKPVKAKEPHSSGIFIIQNINTVGFNNDYILATSNNNDTLMYWIIDKTIDSKEMGYDDNSNLILSNVNEVELDKFNRTLIESKIVLKTKADFR